MYIIIFNRDIAHRDMDSDHISFIHTIFVFFTMITLFSTITPNKVESSDQL
jgi:hypothetical protein